MINTLVLLTLTHLFVLGVGVLVGNGYTTREQYQRGKAQAAIQRDLRLQYRALREYQEAAEEELLWLAKQQAGLVVINYDQKVSPKDQQLPGRPGRPTQWK